MEQEDYIKNELGFFIKHPIVFTVSDFIENIDSTIDPQFAHRTLMEDQRFLFVSGSNDVDASFISKRILIKWFAYLSIQLAKAKKSVLKSQQIHLLSNSLNIVNGGQDGLLENIVSFGKEMGFLHTHSDIMGYFFPLAYIMPIIETAYPDNAIFHEMIVTVNSENALDEESLLQTVETVLSSLPPREAYVLYHRSNLRSAKQTLQQISEELGCTRERVRQIEKKAIGRRFLKKTFLTILIKEIICRKGNLVYKDSPKIPIITFIAECLDIPCLSVPGIAVLGISKKDISKKVPLNKKADKASVICFLKNEFYRALNQNTDKTDNVGLEKKSRRISLLQRLYITLKNLGRPAHYSTIISDYEFLFPNNKCTDSTILNALGRERHAAERETLGIVWIGARGMYALKEWGYDRPNRTLYQTISKIVREHYRKTHKPVPRQVIVSEIGRYRKFIRLPSIMRAIYSNPNIRCISPKHFIPKYICARKSHTTKSLSLDSILADLEKTYSKSDLSHTR